MKVGTIIMPELQIRKIRGKNDLGEADPLQADLTEERYWITPNFHGSWSGLIAFTHRP